MTFSCCMSSDVFALPPSSKPQLLNLTYRRLNSLPFSRVHCTLCRETGVVVGGGRVHSGGPLPLPSLICILLTSAAPSRWPCEPLSSPFPYLCLHGFLSSATSRSVPLFILRSAPQCFWQIHLISGAFQPCSDSAVWLHN